MSLRRAVALLAGLGLAAVVAAAPAMAAEPKHLQVMAWNMCGSQRASWNCDLTKTVQQRLDVVKLHVNEHGVQAVLLQEVCEDDLALLIRQLGSGWSSSFQPYQWSEAGVRTTNRCGDERGRLDRIGTAIVIVAGMSDPRFYPTTQPWTGLHRPFHCATATYWAVRLCNAHLTPPGGNPNEPTWEYVDDQLAEIKSIVADFPRLVVGGDFNVKPPDWPGNTRAWVWPTGFYSSGPGTPGYLECDQEGAARTGRSTHDSGAKIDYIFSNQKRNWRYVAASAMSDHHVLVESLEVS
jgi:hypothetical protein